MSDLDHNNVGNSRTPPDGGSHLRARKGRPSALGDEGRPETEDGRCQAVFVRYDNQASAMGARERFVIRWKNLLNRVFCCKGPPKPAVSGGGESSDVESGGRTKQYRLAATRREKKSNICRKVARWCGLGSQPGGLNQQRNLARYLHWMFRVNFFFLFVLSCIVFFTLTFIFAGFIIIAGDMDRECVRIGGEEFNKNGDSKFADAFALSWTTFSTVGYGSTYPALSHENDNRSNCAFITIICSLEAFIGVLYSGFCGAILFGKVLRMQSHAQVIFSDPIVIRYGSGLEEYNEDEDNKEQTDGKKVPSKIPLPCLEFRVVNRLFDEVGGEIMDATLNCVANIDADDADPTVRDAADTERQHWERQREGTSMGSISNSEHGSDAGSAYMESSQHSFFNSTYLGFGSRRAHQAVDEDPTSKLVQKRIFSKLIIEATDHPFFKRVWLARHVLDETSPLLTPRARKKIRRNKGYWPPELNNYASVRESLQFNQILVSLNGVSNVSASDVYAQKIYDFVDLSIGYQFVNLLYRDESGVLKVDLDLINDVREQDGENGGEPLVMDG